MRVAVFLAFAALIVVGVAAFVYRRRLVRAKLIANPRRTEHPRTDGLSGEISNPRHVHAHLEIDYQDGNGSWTRRFVQVKEFDNDMDGGIMIGHCELRGAARTFRFDRIKQCVDLETGEAVEDVQKYLNNLYSSSTEASIGIHEASNEVNH